MKWLAVTDINVKIPRNARAKTLAAAWATADVQKKWAATSWAKKIAAKLTKAGLNDFERHTAKVASQKVNRAAKAKAEKA